MNQVLEKHLAESEGFVSRAIEKPASPFSEVSVESVLLDADLFVKYRSIDKAFNLLQEAIERSPRSIALREKLREIAITHKNLTEAARQCLALVNLYIAREEFDVAYDRLQEAKLLDPRISVAPGLEAIRRARRPEFDQNKDRTPIKVRTDCAIAGDISLVGIFDIIQVIENSKMTGLLVIKSDVHLANVSFNRGKIVDAEADGFRGEFAFKIIVEINSGGFEFSLSGDDFPIVISVSSNTNFLLDVLTQLDTEKAEKQGMRNLGLEDF